MGELTASILPSSGAFGCDASTTVLSVIPFIKDNAGITLLTNSIRIPNDFMYDKIRIISTGGNLRSRTQSLQGELTSRAMEGYFLDLCVLSCRSMDLENGIYEGDEEEAYFKNVMVAHSRRVILLADHTKFNKTSLIRTLSYDKVDVLVTDQKPSDEWILRMKERKVRVLYPGVDFT
jgi:DeoR/GlpR family transcriptional regulator of sugar metabolism